MAAIQHNAREQYESALEKSFLKWWGYDSFRNGQLEACVSIMSGTDTFVLMGTGTGKSIAYQLPPVALRDQGVNAVSIIVSPLLSLIEDQVMSLRALGISAGFIGGDSSVSDEQSAAEGKFAVLYTTPEKLIRWNHGLLQLSERATIIMLAIDESHCVSEWGHDFRPEYRQLGSVRELFSSILRVSVPLMALTATATPEVQTEIIANLRMTGSPAVWKTSFNRRNLKYFAYHRSGHFDVVKILSKYGPVKAWDEVMKSGSDRLPLVSLARSDGNNNAQRIENSISLAYQTNKNFVSALIYVNTRREAEEICDTVSRCHSLIGITVAFYHAGLSASERHRVHAAFSRDEISVVVATVAFGMGIHKPDIRLVINFGLPKSVESYYQQTGRAGRDGATAYCVLLYNRSDIVKCFNVSSKNFTTSAPFGAFISVDESKRLGNDIPIDSGGKSMTTEDRNKLLMKKIYAMNEYANGAITCRRQYLLNYFGEDYLPHLTPLAGDPSRRDSHCCDLCDAQYSAPTTASLNTASGSGASEAFINKTLRKEFPISANAPFCTNPNLGADGSASQVPSVPTSASTDFGKEIYLLLSTVVDCGESYGIGVPLGVLIGSHDKSVQRVSNYNKLRTFGLGADRSKAWWKALSHQLADSEGLLASVLTRCSSFSYERYEVTPKGKNFLDQHIGVRAELAEGVNDSLNRISCVIKPSREFAKILAVEGERRFIGRPLYTSSSSSASTRLQTAAEAATDFTQHENGHCDIEVLRDQLMTSLAQARAQIAAERAVNPYHILSTADLHAMVYNDVTVPLKPSSLSAYPGWGCWKVQAFGAAICEAISRFAFARGFKFNMDAAYIDLMSRCGTDKRWGVDSLHGCNSDPATLLLSIDRASCTSSRAGSSSGGVVAAANTGASVKPLGRMLSLKRPSYSVPVSTEPENDFGRNSTTLLSNESDFGPQHQDREIWQPPLNHGSLRKPPKQTQDPSSNVQEAVVVASNATAEKQTYVQDAHDESFSLSFKPGFSKYTPSGVSSREPHLRATSAHTATAAAGSSAHVFEVIGLDTESYRNANEEHEGQFLKVDVEVVSSKRRKCGIFLSGLVPGAKSITYTKR